MQKLKRNINVGFRVTEDEQAMIRRRMKQTNIKNLRAYLLKMAIDGRVINFESDSINDCSKLLRNISANINQIARRVNETGNVYDTDLADIKARQGEIWAQQDEILKRLAAILEVV